MSLFEVPPSLLGVLLLSVAGVLVSDFGESVVLADEFVAESDFPF